MNQRSTHFELGKTSASYGSIYTKDYPPKETSHEKLKLVDPFRGSSLAPDNKTSFTTTNQAMLKGWDNAQKASMDPAKLKDLRSHHFQLGSYHPNGTATTHKFYYDRKEINNDALKNQEESKKNMRAHHHDFKEQNFTNFKSTYVNQYVGKEGAKAAQIKNESGNSIIFGAHNLPMLTTSKGDYTKKDLNNAKAASTLQQNSALVLGDKSEPMTTMNQMYYDQKPIMKNQLPEATMKELRNTHFNLGNMQSSYATETNNYKGFPKQQLNFQIPTYASGTWEDKAAKFNGATTNGKQLPPRQVAPYQKAQPPNREGFSLGGHNGGYQTEFNQHFVPKESSYNGPSAGKETVQDSVSIGSDHGYYQTEQRAKYTEKDLRDAKINTNVKELNKGDHFAIGGQMDDAYITVYQDEYRKDQQQKSKIFHKDNVKPNQVKVQE